VGDARVGIVVNPAAGRDVRRLAARAAPDTPQDKRNCVARAVIGAAAAGATHFCVVREPFGISEGAVENLRIGARFEVIDVGASLRPADTGRAVEAMRAAGCRVLIVLGGDGTNRLVARAWPDAVLLPLSTGTNNVFPWRVEPTAGGAAAGTVAAGAIALEDCAPRAKRIEVEIEDEPPDLALIDAAFLVGDSPGNLLPFDAEHLRALVLARAEPQAVGLSPVGGLLLPCGAADEGGVWLRCDAPRALRTTLLAPLSPGLYRRVGVVAHGPLAPGERLAVVGPGLLAFDGDRARELAPGQRAWLRVERSGPRVIDPALALAAAARSGWFADRHWHDALDEARGGNCC
jgi:hypothetical protein